MEKKHALVELAEVQREQGTSYCAGLDPHLFGSYEKNMEIYDKCDSSFYEEIPELMDFYINLARCSGLSDPNDVKYAALLSAIELYIKKIIAIMVIKCNIRVFKPQYGFYEQFGPAGSFMLQRIRNCIKNIEKSQGIRLICILDCKRGDIATTQAGYFLGLMGNLEKEFGIDFAPYDFDIINVTPWMGKDVLVLEDKDGKPLFGQELIKEKGKAIIVVNKTSNPSGPDYQEIEALSGETVQMENVLDVAELSDRLCLEYGGLSALGLVVGSTHPCDGSIRAAFPGTTLLVPGFGAQGGKFSHIMLELIRDDKWNGQGAIFSSSRGSMYPFMSKYGGSGDIKNLQEDMQNAIKNFRQAEKLAYDEPEIEQAGIFYPY